jgi:hypothetical protein
MPRRKTKQKKEGGVEIELLTPEAKTAAATKFQALAEKVKAREAKLEAARELKSEMRDDESKVRKSARAAAIAEQLTAVQIRKQKAVQERRAQQLLEARQNRTIFIKDKFIGNAKKVTPNCWVRQEEGGEGGTTMTTVMCQISKAAARVGGRKTTKPTKRKTTKPTKPTKPTKRKTAKRKTAKRKHTKRRGRKVARKTKKY